MSTPTTTVVGDAADRLLGPSWRQLTPRDKAKVAERLRQLRDTEQARRPPPADPTALRLAADRQRITQRGPLALLTELIPPGDRSPFWALHRHLNAWHLTEAGRPPGAKQSTAAARGHAKTTVGTEYGVAWTAALGFRRFIVIVSATWEQARDRVQAIVAITEDERTRELYPDLRPGLDGEGRTIAWRDDDVVFANGVRVLGVGVGKSIRGIKHQGARPDLLVLDDLEDENSVATDEAIEKRRRWLMRVALQLGAPTVGLSVLWVGSILSRSALLNLATAAALEAGQPRPAWARQWSAKVFPAEVPGSEQIPTPVTLIDDATGATYTVTVQVGEPAWAGGMTREALARLKAGDVAAYSAEYLCDPVADATSMLAPPRRATWVNPTAPPLQRVARTDDGRLVPVLAMTRACALDPQYSSPKPGSTPDLAAVVVAGQYGAESFLLDAWIGRDRHGQAQRLVAMGTAWGCYAGGVEAVGAQVLTADSAAAFGSLPIVAIKRPERKTADRSAKEQRALGLSVRLGDRARPGECRVHALPDTDLTDDLGVGPGHGPLTHFLGYFPGGRFDDPVDATVDAVELASRGAGAGGPGSSAPAVGQQRVRQD